MGCEFKIILNVSNNVETQWYQICDSVFHLDTWCSPDVQTSDDISESEEGNEQMRLIAKIKVLNIIRPWTFPPEWRR